jgi:hypothetical protein
MSASVVSPNPFWYAKLTAALTSRDRLSQEEIAELGRDACRVIAPPGWRLASRASLTGLDASHGGRHLTQYLHIRAVGALAGNMPDHHA